MPKMTMQWVCESTAEFHDFQGNNDYKTRDDFLRLTAKVDERELKLIHSLIESLLTEDKPLEFKPLLELIQQQVELQFDPTMLLTMACAQALEKGPQLEVWLKIRKIARDSWQLENWLSKAMSAHAQNSINAGQAYIDLAIQLFNALDSGVLKSESKRKNEDRERVLSYWQEAQYQLDELWWELRGSDFMSYEEEMGIFGLLSEISPTEFQQLIAKSKNPFLVDAALLSAGVWAFSPRFAQWETCVKAAPIAFTQDGNWTKSVLLPLLLMHARNELLKPGRKVPRYKADEREVAVLTEQVSKLIQSVVDLLASREDALATFSRWSTWLMRQQIRRQSEKEFNDIRSDAFVDNALLEAMGKKMQGQRVIQDAPEDAAPWEVWCYRCVLSLFAHDGFIEMPSLENFYIQWKLTPENWYETQGRNLLEYANLHIPNDDMPGLSANFLVLPIASQNTFSNSWQQLWDSSYQLREVLEFGSVDAKAKKYSDRVDASSLLLLLACMGLACFDQAAARLETSTEQLVEEMTSLHRSLNLAIMEVLHIDNTNNRDKWQKLLQHLALRRAYWDSNYTKDRFALFTGRQESTVRDYLSHFQADPAELVTFLHACILNNLDASTLRKDLSEASIDLRSCVSTLKRLHELRSHRYPMNAQAINAIEPLMVGVTDEQV